MPEDRQLLDENEGVDGAAESSALADRKSPDPGLLVRATQGVSHDIEKQVLMPPKKKTPVSGTEKTGSKKKKKSQPTQVNPNGTRVKVIGANGRVRWEWQKKSG